MLKKIIQSGVLGIGVIMLVPALVCAESLTAKLCREKVIEAAKLLEAEGDAAIAKIKDDKGPFRFAGGEGYLWIHNLEGKMVMHPTKSNLDGQDILAMADPDGFALFAAMTELAEEKGQGWVPYRWPKPNSKDVSPKVSFVKLVKNGDKGYIVGSGLYDVTVDQVKKEFAGDAVYEK